MQGVQYVIDFISKRCYINETINQLSKAPISLTKPGSVARQPNGCSTAKSMKQFRNIDRSSGMLVSLRERPSERDVT